MAVLLTRSQADSERIAKALDLPAGQVLIWPFFTTRYLAVRPVKAPVQALLFTSANGVLAFAAGSAVRDLPALCVGDRTAEVARGSGFAEVLSAGGTAEDLAGMAHASAHRHLLYLRGREISVDLAATLRDGGLTVTEDIVYAVEQAGPPAQDIDQRLRSGAVSLITLWSAAAGRHLAILTKQHAWMLDQTDILAISEKTAEPVAGTTSPFRRVIVAQAPNAKAMIAAIHAAMRQKNG